MIVPEFTKMLYIGSKAPSVQLVKDLFDKRIKIYETYFICVDKYSKFYLEILSSDEIFKEIYSIKKYTIIGIAGDKKEAFLIVKDIIEDFVIADGNFKNIKEYLLNTLNQ